MKATKLSYSSILFLAVLASSALTVTSCNKDSGGPSDQKVNENSKDDAREQTTTFNPQIVAEYQSEADVDSVAYSADGSLLAIGSEGEKTTIKVINIKTNTVVYEAYHGHSVFRVAFSPNGKLLATGTFGDGTVRIVDLTTRKTLFSILHGAREITSVEFSPDGKYLISGCHDTKVRIIDVATGLVVHEIKHDEDIKATYSPDGKYIVTLGNGGTLGTQSNYKVRIFDAATKSELFTIKNYSIDTNSITSAAFSPDQKFVTIGFHKGQMKTYELATGNLSTVSPDVSNVLSVKYSPDGRFIAAANARQDYNSNTEQSYISFNLVETGKGIYSISTPDFVHSISYSPDGEHLAAGTKSGKVLIYKLYKTF